MNFVEWLRIIVMGIVEGITEWLPISSTGHMLLLDAIWPTSAPEVITDSFWDMFIVVIQLGAILAVVLLYFNKLNPFSSQKTQSQKAATFSLWGKVIIGCIPAGIAGLLFDDLVSEYLHGPFVIAGTLIFYGIVFILIERRNRGRRLPIQSFSAFTYKDALIVGCFQILALIPGTSRSGITIIAATLLGASRFIAAEYSFFLAIPVMFGASFLKIVKFLANGDGFTGTQFIVLLVGMFTAFVVSILAIRFLMTYIKKNDFTAFGIYRIILGIIVILYFTFA